MSKKYITIGSKYLLGPRLGVNQFGEVYVVTQTETSQLFVLKRLDQKSKNSTMLLEMRLLKQLQHSVGFNQIKWSGIENKYNMFVMDMLGPSLQDLFQICGKKFTLKTTIMVVDQMLERIQLLHSKSYVHRDIRPSNFLMGMNKKSHIVHLIDFVLSKKYRDSKTYQHIPYKQNKILIGTIRFVSINGHLGIEQSRRDDLQSIAYILVYFLNGSLPWQGIKTSNKNEKYQKILQMKMSFPIEIQCNGLPWQISSFVSYCQSLKFDQKPNYMFLRKLLRDLFEKEGLKFDYCYDWTIFPPNKILQNGKMKIELKGNKNIATKSLMNISRMKNNSKMNQKIQIEQKKQYTVPKPNEKKYEQSEFLEDGQQNIDEFGIDDEGIEANDGHEDKIEREIDLEDKKNKLYDDDIQLDDDD